MRIFGRLLVVVLLIIGVAYVAGPVQSAVFATDEAPERSTHPGSRLTLVNDSPGLLDYNLSTNGDSAQHEIDDSLFQIQSTKRISIPYGFQSTLPILAPRQEVIATGHGGCTQGQQFTVAITVTQPYSGAEATGNLEETCTGELQTWRTRALPTGVNYLTTGPGEACGFAVTMEAGDITDTYEWCRDVNLVELVPRSFLPVGIKP